MNEDTPMFSDKDYQTLLHEHTEVTGKINDMLIDFQNKAFAAGKESANEEINQLRAENERLKDALLAARPYVEGAYGYSFPNEQKNQSVLDAINKALSHPAQKQEEKKDA
jgi:hypothetical protein